MPLTATFNDGRRSSSTGSTGTFALWAVLLWIGYDATQARVLEDELGDLATFGSARCTEIADGLKTYSQRTH